MQEGAKVLDPKHYLLRMAKHSLADHYSARIVMESIDEAKDVVDEDALRQLEQTDSYIYEEVLEQLKAADELTYRIFLLYFGYDLTIKQTAKALGVAEMTVKNKLYRTLKKLKKEMKEGENYALFRSS
jgi:RNA polymerase sigma-70 factor (ECF subfamily)